MNTQRNGSSLMELLVALPIAALLTAVAVHMLLHVHRQVVDADGALGATRELRHGANILVGEWRGLHNTDLVAWTDTSIEFQSIVGIGIVCTAQTPRNTVAIVERDAVSAPMSPTGNPPSAAVWNQSLQTGDMVQLWFAGSSPVDSLTAYSVRIQSSTSANDCVGSVLQGSSLGKSLRLTFTDSLRSAPAVGTPVRMTRRTRYSLYRSSDGDWYLGRKTQGPSGWDVIQPVAGPLLAPSDRGLIISVLDSARTLLESTSPSSRINAMHLHALMRAPAQVGRSSTAVVNTDSLSFDVSLRIR